MAAIDNHVKSYILLFSVMAGVTLFASIAVAGTAKPHDQRIQAAVVFEEVVEPIIGAAR